MPKHCGGKVGETSKTLGNKCLIKKQKSDAAKTLKKHRSIKH